MRYAVTEDTTGRIMQYGTCQSLEVSDAPTGYTVREFDEEGNQQNYYWNSVSFALKTALGASWDKMQVTADSVDEAVLSPLPVPCTVVIDGDSYIISDGAFEFSADMPGSYEITINDPAYIKENWVIEAV